MPHAALIDAVQQQTAAAIAAVWSEARADAARCKGDADRAIEQHREQHAARLREFTAACIREARSDAARRSRAIRAAARAAIADRLRVLAAASLIGLRGNTSSACFAMLAAELPARAWTQVAVHPDDVATAQAHFPRSTVLADVAISGGIIAGDGELSVDNTLERRLAAAWPDLLPAVMSDVLHLLEHSRVAA